MTRAQAAMMRLRGDSGLIRVHWPAGRGTAPILVLFAGEQDAPPFQLCGDPGLLVLSASGTRTAKAIAVAEWSADHAVELGAARGPLFVAGSGTGARLALAVAWHARDRGWPHIAGQILADPGFEREPSDDDPYAEPLRAASLAGVAPATVAGGGRYVARLRRAGVYVDEIDAGPGALVTAVRHAYAHLSERNSR